MKSDECDEDFSPCTCIQYDPEREITCKDVRTDEIRQVFNRVSAQYIYQVTIELFEEDIPADLFSDKIVFTIDLTCNSSELLLSIDPNAFRYTRNYTDYFLLRNCNLLRMNSKYLECFNRLRSLYFESISNLQPALATLPTLPILSLINIYRCPNDFIADMEYDTSSILSSKLGSLFVNSGNWSEGEIGWMLKWLSKRNSTNNIYNVQISCNALRRIPPEVALIDNFMIFVIYNNTVPINVDSSAFNFVYPSTTSYLGTREVHIINSYNGVVIQPGAFQGNFSWPTAIDLSNNQLTLFEEDVFYPVLEQFASTDLSHRIQVNQSIINCFKNIFLRVEKIINHI